MLVFGEGARSETTADKIARIREALAAAAATRGIERHGLLVAALIEAGELVQGLADNAFAQNADTDDRCPEADAAMAVATELARRVDASWSSGFVEADLLLVDATEIAIDRLSPMRLPATVTVKRPEGFAYYGVYPECYAAAARSLPTDDVPRVIGIRSIGATLAAMLSAAAGAPTPQTLRSVGHPFRRHVSVAPRHTEALVPAAPARFAVADEGPGLSGSSFGAVATFLTERGVSPKRIHFSRAILAGRAPRRRRRSATCGGRSPGTS